MASTYEYIISLQDKVTGTMRSIIGTSAATAGKLSALSDKAGKLREVTGDLSGSMFQLKQRIGLLQQEKELLDPSNIGLIKQYNREIDSLAERMERLDNAGRGGKLKGYLAEIGNQVKGFINPATMGAAALGFSGKSAMGFREGMAKVNTTAQLDETGLADLENRLKEIATRNRADIGLAPGAFESIISQTGDVEMSLDIMDAALKGSKAGFTDLATVAGALSQTMSILGGSADSLEVLDTFFAAKRVGAGEFADFATYMPGLIASADSLGVKYKSVAGVFAYMTGKGQDAARASVLMGNMFSALGRTDITQNLDKAGVKIFDAQGRMRDLVEIFRDLGGVMAGMSDEQKAAFLDKTGIVDKEAKAAFAIMGSDLGKLSEAMDATAHATGETSAALEYSKNPVQAATGLWNQFKGIGLQVGGMLLPVIGAGLAVLQSLLSGVSAILDGTIAFFSGWADSLREGNPPVWGITAALGALAVALAAYELWTNRAVIAAKAKALWDGVVATATGGWTAVQWALNAALHACPLVWIITLVVGLVAAIAACAAKVQGWGKQWGAIVRFMKNVWDLFVESFKFRWNVLTNGFMMGLDKIKLGWYKFKEAVGLGDSSENRAMIAQLDADVERRKRAIAEGADKVKGLAAKTAGSLTWELSWKKEPPSGEKQPVGGVAAIPPIQPVMQPIAGAGFNALMQQMGGGSKGENGKGDNGSMLPGIPGGESPGKGTTAPDKTLASNKGDTAYNTIAARLSMIKMPGVAIPAIDVQTPPAEGMGEAVDNTAMMSTLPPEAAVPGMDNADYTGKDTRGLIRSIAENASGLRGIAAGIALAVSVGGMQPDGVGGAAPATQMAAAPVAEAVSGPLNGIAGNLLPPRQMVPEPSGTGDNGDARRLFRSLSENLGGLQGPASGVPSPELPGISLPAAPRMDAAPELPASTPSTPSTPAAVEESGRGASPAPRGRNMYLEKYCDQVVINIRNTDQRGLEEIRASVMETLTGIFDPYEA